ncbi:MAG: ComEC/Rec2 family competence protein [Clostridia bacterium]|nr:ComEC/Rec2 family competence protein [Clostridia bacterium]
MKRPFVIIGILSLILSFAALYLGKNWIIAFCVCLLFCGAILYLVKRKLFLRLVVPLLVLILAVVNYFCTLNNIKTVEELPLEEITVKGVVCDTPKIYPNGQAVTIKSKELKGKVWVFSGAIYDIKTGDTITLSIKPQKMDESQRANNYSQGIYLSGFLNQLKNVNRPKFSFLRLMADFREWIENTISANCNLGNEPLLVALTTGNKSYINISDQKAINNAGVSHIMAVSGLHLGIICLNLVHFLRKLKVNDKIIGICGLSTVFLVLLACGFQISAIRASVVYIILLMGNIIHRKGDGLNSLFVAITLIIAANPLVVGSISFLLSASSTFGIIVLYPMISKLLGGVKRGGRIGKILNSGLQIALVSFSAIICSMPVLVYYFESVSTVAILVNVLVLFAANLVLVLTVIGLVISIIPILNIISTALFFLAEIGMEYFMMVVRFFGSSNLVLLYMKKEMVVFWIIFAVAIFIFSYLGVKRSEKSGS